MVVTEYCICALLPIDDSVYADFDLLEELLQNLSRCQYTLSGRKCPIVQSYHLVGLVVFHK